MQSTDDQTEAADCQPLTAASVPKRMTHGVPTSWPALAMEERRDVDGQLFGHADVRPIVHLLGRFIV